MAGDMTPVLPWHDGQWQTVHTWQTLDRLPHGILLEGVPGLGKRQFADRLAQRLLCEGNDKAAAPCGQCRACRMLAGSGAHPDYFVLERLYNEKKKKLERHIVVDQIRAFSEHLAMTAGRGNYKVALIWLAEEMTHQAANALLKTLEEPARNTIMLLVSHNASLLLPTLRSRVQRLTFLPTQDAAAVHWLAQQDAELPVDAELGMHLFHGAPLAALDYAGQEQEAFRKQLIDDLAALQAQRATPVEVAERWLKSDLKHTVYWLYGAVTDLLRLKSQPDAGIANRDRHHDLQQLAERLNYAVLFKALDWCHDVSRVTQLGKTLNEQLLLEQFTINWNR